MVKLKNPLISLDARGTLAKALSFVKRRGQNLAEKKPEPFDAKTGMQLSWRHMYQKAVALWNALSSDEKLDWEKQASGRHMTGFAWFMSQALKPNPGIYLPLQGGTMAGDIDMAKNRLLKLPLPTDSQEPLTLAYYTANIAPYLCNQGARVYNWGPLVIPDSTLTALTFDSERYDTDNIHDNFTNNSRLTAKTAGRYLIIGNVAFEAQALGSRELIIREGGFIKLAVQSMGLRADYFWIATVSTITHLNVNQYVELVVYQNSGPALNVLWNGEYSPEFMMERLTP